MAGASAPAGENALSRVHAFDILRGGFKADKNNLFPSVGGGLRFMGGEINFSAGGSRGSGKSGGDNLGLF